MIYRENIYTHIYIYIHTHILLCLSFIAIIFSQTFLFSLLFFSSFFPTSISLVVLSAVFIHSHASAGLTFISQIFFTFISTSFLSYQLFHIFLFSNHLICGFLIQIHLVLSQFLIIFLISLAHFEILGCSFFSVLWAYVSHVPSLSET